MTRQFKTGCIARRRTVLTPTSAAVILAVLVGLGCSGEGGVIAGTGGSAGSGGSAASGGSAGSGGIATGRCTVRYDLDVTFRTSEEGATIVPGSDGSMLVQYTADDSGTIIEGPVDLLYYWVFQNVIAASLDAVIATSVHGFAPDCNGETDPTWRLPTDPRFPIACEYTGNTTPLATGTLDMTTGLILWDTCDAADDYWSSDANAYTLLDTSTGSGCLNDFHNVGNINCDADTSECELRNLAVGDNPLHDHWTQPLINGPPASGMNSVSIRDLQASTITSPTGASDGFLSYNLPNDVPSRTWIGWVGTRDASSELTTCR